MLERAERTAALVVLEVDPVAGALALERDHARALLARLVAPDVGEPQLVAHAPAISEVRGHPARGGRPQPRDDGVQVVVGLRQAEWSGIVEIDHDTPTPPHAISLAIAAKPSEGGQPRGGTSLRSIRIAL